MNLRVQTNALETSEFMRRLFRDQLPFATAMAVRRTALAFQQHQRKHQRQVFTVRRAMFLDRAVKIRDWPTKQDPTAIVRIEPPGGPDKAAIIARHEEGGTRPPGPGHRGLAVPDAARPSPRQLVPERLRPAQLGLKRVDKGQGSKQVFAGRLRTFMVREPDGSGVILQRTGKGKSGTYANTRKLFEIAEGGVQIEPVLSFEENAEKVVNAVFPEEFAAAWDKALETAR